ncbi:DUF2029 domain-containing protein [Methylacidiphilum caldifontis]|uniref:glycosyltransferase family 87 protein n=1 Tax=Methylacidiphilum caldifontis TaxID=2795386 RepID=UPI001A8EAB86|nr:glycosyltransferase family 87 protein [Methylacidiphilum caldifontis]QSR87908.1 DUF2029 domain-containing protein [Methylacidiphilum caldifontis]
MKTQPLFSKEQWAGYALWAILFVVICLMIAHNPTQRTVSLAYIQAAERFIEKAPLYEKEGIHGFLYFPHFALFFCPFAFLAPLPREILWRLFSLGLFIGAIQKVSSSFFPLLKPKAFLYFSLLVMVSAMASLRNGQTNLALAAVLLLAFVSCGEKKWIQAAFFFFISLILKPIALYPFLYAAFFFPAFRKTALATILLFILFPFLFSLNDLHYVYEQYLLFFKRMLTVSQPTEANFADIQGLLFAFSVKLSSSLSLLIRLLGAIGTILLGMAFDKKNPSLFSVLLYSFSTAYLLLFNPRTELNSYVFLGLSMAFFSLYFLSTEKKQKAAFLFILLTPLLGIEALGGTFVRLGLWLKPAICLFVQSLLVFLLIKKRLCCPLPSNPDREPPFL